MAVKIRRSEKYFQKQENKSGNPLDKQRENMVQ